MIGNNSSVCAGPSTFDLILSLQQKISSQKWLINVLSAYLKAYKMPDQYPIKLYLIFHNVVAASLEDQTGSLQSVFLLMTTPELKSGGVWS